MRDIAMCWYLAAGCAVLVGSAQACDLKVESAWIREAPPTAANLAGYAKLINTGGAPLRIQSIQSPFFAMVEAHETLNENGVSKMRAIKTLEIPAKGSMVFSPNGKHLMLMSPKQALKKGDAVAVSIKDSNGCVSKVNFTVSAAAPVSPTDMTHTDHQH